jgi:radical SAM superfamily enzyme YgiQ (UPF0313 family)
MNSGSLDRWLLVNYAGYPYAPNSFMPDNGLANLAGALARNGKQVEILDYSTVSTFRKFSSPDLCKRLLKVWDTNSSLGDDAISKLRRTGLLLSLSRCHRQRGIITDSLVENICRDLVEKIERDGIQAIGFKLWNGDGLDGSVRMARAVRKHAPRTKIFGGGPHVDIFMERLKAHCDCFDALAYGEGERTIQLLAETGGNLSSFKEIPNLLFERDGSVHRTEAGVIDDLDDLPMPLYRPDVYPAMADNEKIKIIVIDESRGCRNNCAFCIHPVKSSHRLRVKSIGRLIRETEAFERDLAVRSLRFGGSCTPYELLNAFAAELVRTERKLRFTSFAHVRGSDDADFDLLRQSGCEALFFGIESGSQQLLDTMRKGVKTDMIPAAIRGAKQAGIFTVGSLILPAPGENDRTRKETVDLLARERPDALTVQPPIVVPRTDWCERPEKYGISIRNRDKYLESAMHAKFNLLLPPAFWKSLPLLVDGKGYKRVLRETGSFLREIERLGYTTSVSDDTYLMSVKAGMDVAAFRNETRKAFFAGDARRVADIVALTNSGD